MVGVSMGQARQADREVAVKQRLLCELCGMAPQANHNAIDSPAVAARGPFERFVHWLRVSGWDISVRRPVSRKQRLFNDPSVQNIF